VIESLELARDLCEIGIKSRRHLELRLVQPFKSFFDSSGELIYSELERLDGNLTRRELLSRYLLLNAVLDQGPDMEGVAIMLRRATSVLYDKGIRFFHEPELFFNNLDTIIQAVKEGHQEAKSVRSKIWADTNNSNPSKYNLFFAQSTRGQVSIKQVMDYVIHRWGVPISLFLLLERGNRRSHEPLVDYLESYDSAEVMSAELKDNPEFGLGSAIGDKASHLFAKNYVSIYNLKRKTDDGWSAVSFELPFDSNAGRVLFRTGFFLRWLSMNELKAADALQEGKGKQGADYIRVTNIRGLTVNGISNSSKEFQDYTKIIRTHLKIGTRPQQIQIQRLPNLLVYTLNKEGQKYSLADFDDGLMEIGTNYCFNTLAPLCQKCPIRNHCQGYNENPTLITQYRT
jgi:hypothetical protein